MDMLCRVFVVDVFFENKQGFIIKGCFWSWEGSRSNSYSFNDDGMHLTLEHFHCQCSNIFSHHSH